MCWGRGIKCCTVPDQLVVDKQLEFRVKVGKTNTEGGPVVGREHREKEVDGRAMSATRVEGHRRCYRAREDTGEMKEGWTMNVRGGGRTNREREKEERCEQTWFYCLLCVNTKRKQMETNRSRNSPPLKKQSEYASTLTNTYRT